MSWCELPVILTDPSLANARCKMGLDVQSVGGVYGACSMSMPYIPKSAFGHASTLRHVFVSPLVHFFTLC